MKSDKSAISLTGLVPILSCLWEVICFEALEAGGCEFRDCTQSAPPLVEMAFLGEGFRAVS